MSRNIFCESFYLCEGIHEPMDFKRQKLKGSGDHERIIWNQFIIDLVLLLILLLSLLYTHKTNSTIQIHNTRHISFMLLFKFTFYYTLSI